MDNELNTDFSDLEQNKEQPPEENELTLEDRLKEIEEKEKKLNERELKADYNTQISEWFNSRSLNLPSELNKKLESFIDFTDKKSFNKSFNNLTDLISDVRKLETRQAYTPLKGSKPATQSDIEKAFKPPKVY